MNEPLVSIIVPMYNSENTILNSINSLICQSWSNIEILVIDDGSKDNSIGVVESIKDKRIKVIKQENRGVSSARNVGLENSNGEFLLFVDADDYVDFDMVNGLMKYSKEKSIVFSNTYVKENKGEYILKLFNNINEPINMHMAMKEIISGGGGLICSKLVSKKIIDESNIRFNKHLVLGEDQLFFLQVAAHSEEFIYVDEAFYHYDRTDEGSTTNRYHENLVDNYIILQKEISEIFMKTGYYSMEDKNILNNKIKRWLWECIDNHVKAVRSIGLKLSIKSVKSTLEKVNIIIELEYINIASIRDQIIYMAIKKQSNISIFNLMVISKLLMIRNG